ncbi:A disintegrin and metalloproteinase with thrombospondin motifs 17-like isoform X2 [Antedon mediterranea]|uniref:A disintegrin and metalloproteinase with thrombospondin motifs 17-like isoform X2 n=1 Tax=Antedon mediterranea TaxID=105859 RepID=UPI003AF9E300
MYWLNLVLIYVICDRVGAVSSDQGVNSRIALKHDKYIELFVVIDHLTYSYHGDDTENYVMEMLKVQLIDDMDDANSILMDFRRWLERDPSRYVDISFDVAVLITRKDMHINSNFDATGKGFVGGTCTDDMKMAIVEDVSPMGLAMSIAHEIGHLLGIYHDYQYSNPLCPDNTYIMSGFAAGGPKSMQWSTCSSDALKSFIKGRRTNCLNTLGIGGEVLSRDHSTGMTYTADYQCSMLRRKKSFSCDREDMCGQLYCTSSPNKDCVTDKRPPLDGTKCGENKWCQQGICVEKLIETELQQTNNLQFNIKRFGVAAHSNEHNAHVFLNILWKITLLFVFIIILKQLMNLIRIGSSHILYKVRNKQIQVV